nr:MAG TPA: Tail tube protein [Caudoviricetes sp.]
MPNIKLGNDTLNGVNTVRLQKAGEAGEYESFEAETVQHADISNDIKAKVLDIVQKVQAKRQNDSIVFVAGSDAHQLESNMDIVGGNLHAGQAMECLSYVIPGIDFCCYLGDYTWGSSTTTLAEGRRHFEDINDDIDGAFRGIPQFRTLGNHDSLRYSEAQNGSIFSEAELYQFCGSYNKDNVNGAALAGYCYRDFDAKKCRVICLNTSENTEKEFVSDTQKLWFANTLKAVGSKTGWNVIILSHHPLDWGNVYVLSNIVNAYYTGTAISIGGTSIDFAGSNSAKILAAFHGHTHCFKAAKLNKISSGVGTEYNVWRVAIPNMCFSRNNEYGKNNTTEYYGIEFGEDTTYNKTANSVNDTAFVVNVVNPSEDKIYSFCFGAGYDREIFTGIQTIAVTGVTLNASSGELTVGGEVTLVATVLPETASNKAVTWSSSKPAVASVNNGVVKALTEGTATITAKTVDGGFTASYALTVKEVQPAVVDLISTYGYADNTRLSTAAGNEKVENGYVTIGHTAPIPVDKTTYPNGATIRVTGAVNCFGDIWSGTDNGAYSAWVLYTGTGTTFSQSSYIKTGSADAVGAITVDEDGKGFTLVLASLTAPRYLKFCVKGSGAAITATLTPN